MIDVKLEKFEGPLTLLMQLIEKEQMDITQISLSKIADQYIEFIKKEENIDPELASDFLLIATKLLFLKSRLLLPGSGSEEEEESEDLERQLKMFKEFLDASQKIEGMLREKNFMFSPDLKKGSRRELLEEASFSPPKKVNKEDLRNALWGVIEKNKPRLEEEWEEDKVEYKMNIEEKVVDIQNKLWKKLQYNFHKLLDEAGSKTEMIVSFLAVLELAKQRSIRIDQEEAFSDIIISK